MKEFNLEKATESFQRLLTKIRKNNLNIQQFGTEVSSIMTEEEALKFSDSISLYYSGDGSLPLGEDNNA